MKSVNVVCLLLSLPAPAIVSASEPVDIGSRRELFVDDLLIGELNGTRLKMHEPQLLRGVPKRPFGHYATVLKDGDRFRLYYRGDKIPGVHWRNGWGKYHANEVTLYAESKDGLHWETPKLGLYQVKSMPAGNIVLADQFLINHNFSPFIDRRPGVVQQRRYKALGGGRYPPKDWSYWKPGEREALRNEHGPGGLYAFVSGDGLHWKRLQQKPVIPEDWGSFDSQNVAFWSEAEKQYVCYFRWMDKGWRSIRRSTSRDFVQWTKPVDMQANQPGEHLYTNGTQPYFRAPHIYIALATRFQAKRSAITDVVFMSTRPGDNRFRRPFKEAFIRPGIGNRGWGNRSNYITWHAVPTSSTEMSMFMYGGDHYVLRMDGFISVHAGYKQGEFITKPFKFSGNRLELNYSTSGAGGIRVEIQDAQGRPIPGFTIEDCKLAYGDVIGRFVKWKDNEEVGRLADKPIRLRFVMNEADLYSIRFAKE